MVGHPREALHRRVGNLRELGWVVEIHGPAAAGREDELFLRLSRDVGVGLPDLLAQDIEVNWEAARLLAEEFGDTAAPWAVVGSAASACRFAASGLCWDAPPGRMDGIAMKTARTLALAVALLFTLGTGSAWANHAWGGYHWARTASPFVPPLQLGDNLTSAWDAYLGYSNADWSNADHLGNPVRTSVEPGLTTGRKCRATSGRVEVCNAAYGNNGWLGLASIWASGSHISQATVKVNDSYFNSSKYNT
ncbi:MAG: hypothetical protein LC808_42690, partial [Actinobacteria bacterium]|nr:hypothetical protein [Actinomycetota bacterium]